MQAATKHAAQALLVAVICATASHAQAQYLGSFDELTALRLNSAWTLDLVEADQWYPVSVELNEAPEDPRFPYGFTFVLEETPESISVMGGEAAFDADGNLIVKSAYFYIQAQGGFDVAVLALPGAYKIEIDFDGQDTSELVATAPAQTAKFGKAAAAINNELGGDLLGSRTQYQVFFGYPSEGFQSFPSDFLVFLDDGVSVVFGRGTLSAKSTLNVGAGGSSFATILDDGSLYVQQLSAEYALSITAAFPGGSKGSGNGGGGGKRNR